MKLNCDHLKDVLAPDLNSGEGLVHMPCHINQSINMSGYIWLHKGCTLKAYLKCLMGKGSRTVSHVPLAIESVICMIYFTSCLSSTDICIFVLNRKNQIATLSKIKYYVIYYVLAHGFPLNSIVKSVYVNGRGMSPRLYLYGISIITLLKLIWRELIQVLIRPSHVGRLYKELGDYYYDWLHKPECRMLCEWICDFCIVLAVLFTVWSS